MLLQRHPDTPCAAIEGIEAEAVQGPDGLLWLRYRLIGDLGRVAMPAPAPPVRTDGLWRRTCFEAFIRPEGSRGYFELNLAPSGAWAAYQFDGYRSGMAPADLTPERCGDGWEWNVRLPPSPWSVALSAVVEETSGAISYWALAHPSGKPDFHHADCFALELAAPAAA